MHGTLSPYIDLRQLPAGRRLFALRNMREEAEGMDAPELLEVIDRALEINREARTVEGQWRHARRVDDRTRKKAAQIDNDLDRALGVLHSRLQQVESLFPEQPEGRLASTVRQELFPDGAAAITRMSFEQELNAVEYMLERLTTEWKDDLADLEIEPVVDKIASLAEAFDDALSVSSQSTTWDEVREINDRGQEAMLHAVAKVLGEFGSNNDEDVATRQRLLKPILEQDERVGELYSRKRSVTDVDPETGEVEDPDGRETDGELEGDGDADGGGSSDGEPSDGDGPSDGEPEEDDTSENESETDGDGDGDSDGEPEF